MDIPLCSHSTLDILIWHYIKNGIFKVKTTYHMGMPLRTRDSKTNGIPSTSTRTRMTMRSLMWKAQVPQKVKFFSWKLCHNIAPTMANMSRRIKELCKIEEETDFHLTFVCP